MLTGYGIIDQRLKRLDAGQEESQDARWIDLLAPDPVEEAKVEKLTGVDVPTREEMREIETSSQLYRQGDTAFATLRILSRSQVPAPVLVDTTFILTPSRLVTVRYGDPTPFRNFVSRAEKEAGIAEGVEGIVLGLMEAVVDRAADLLEEVSDDLNRLSALAFNRGEARANPSIASADLQNVIQRIGRHGDLTSLIRDSLHSLDRALPFLHLEDRGRSEALSQRIDTVRRDVRSLLDQNGYIVTKIQFLLDSTLGLINIQQNAIIKIFSVASVILMPPTLVASVYGMNFEHIPELHFRYGYPMALSAMLVSAVLPYLYFKKRGWL